MGKCFKVDLKLENEYTLLLVYNAMKELQLKSSLIDESVTISYNDKIRITAGFYDNFEDFNDLFMSIVCGDIELIKNHVSEFFPKCEDFDVRKLAFNNICESLKHLNYQISDEDKEELMKLSGLKKRYTKRI